MSDRIVFYLWPRAGGIDLRFSFRLRYAIDALTTASSVYDYYNPDAHAQVLPVRFRIPE